MSFLRKFLFLFLFPASIWAQNTQIHIQAPGAQDKQVRLVVWSDLITKREITEANATINAEGFCKITCNLTDTIPARIYIEFYYIDVFLQPKTQYDIQFPTFDFVNAEDKINPFIDDMQISAKVLENKKPGLNFWMDSLNEVCNLIMTKNFDELYYGRKLKRIDTLENTVPNLFEGVKNSYFQQSLTSKFGLIKQLANLISGEKTFAQYFFDQPILYNNLDYMELFNQYFQEYAIAKSRKVSFYDVRDAINKGSTYAALNDSLGKDSVLVNEVLRELVMLKGLYEVYNHSSFSKISVLKILKETAEISKWTIHKTLAENMLYLLKRFEVGTSAPDYKLNFETSTYLSPETYKGKYLYLFFFTTWSDACMTQMSVLDKYAVKYGNYVRFLGICLDRNSVKFDNFHRETKHAFPIVYFDNQYQFLYDYGVRTFPFSIIIDAEGAFYQYPAEKPGEKLEKLFDKICAPKKK